MSLTIIAAVGRKLELGKRGGLCFRIPGDLRFFKKTTLGHAIFMGLNTWKSLPRKLPGRDHYILMPDQQEMFSPEMRESNLAKGLKIDTVADLPKDIHIVTDLAGFVQKYAEGGVRGDGAERRGMGWSEAESAGGAGGDGAEEIFVIGGGSIYAQLLPHCSRLFLTEVQAIDEEADVFFPEFDKGEWGRESLGWGEDDDIKYEHVLYQRKRKEQNEK